MALRSKVDRAIVAYLQSLGVCDNIGPANSSGHSVFPNVTVWAHDGKPSVQYSGSYEFQVMIEIQSEAAPQPADDAAAVPNPDRLRVQLDELTKAVYEALMQSDDDGQSLDATSDLISSKGRALAVPVGATAEAIQRAENNEDMVDFTCQFWMETGMTGGRPNEEGSAFREILTFSTRCCDSNVD